MKKSSFILGAAALMLATSCSNDEVVNVAESGAAIGFNSFVNNSTRGESTYDNTDDLKVWGVTYRGAEGAYTVNPTELFGCTKVTKEGVAETTGTWTYSPLQYWVEGNAYSFAAIAPYTTPGLDVQQTGTLTSEAGLVLTFDNTAEGGNASLDILYATAAVPNAAANQAAVNLNLKHMLSRVKFEFANGFDQAGKKGAETIEIKDLQINNAVANATITNAEATGTWTAEGTSTFAVSFNAAAEADAAVKTNEMYLIPTTAALEYTINFTVNRLKDGEVIASYKHENVTLGSMNYINNNSYTFKTTINEKTIDPENVLEPIQFTATVNPWTEVTVTPDVDLPKKENK